MKVGRNEPCPCGSGKKYKQCCLGKEEEARSLDYRIRQEWSSNQFQENALEAWFDDWSYEDPEKEFEEDDEDNREDDEDWDEDDSDDEFDEDEDEKASELEASPASGDDFTAEEKFWDDFGQQNLDGKIAILEKLLEEPGTVKPYEMAEILDAIFEAALEAGERECYDVLVEKFRQAAPEAYQFEAETLLMNRIVNAIALRRFEALDGLVKELAALAGETPELFETLIPILCYYGRADLLNIALEIGGPLVLKNDDLSDWVDEVFAPFAVRMVVYGHLERRAAGPSDDAALFQALEKFSKIPQPRLEIFMALLSGQSQREWHVADFQIKRPASYHPRAAEADDPTTLKTTVGQNIFNLSLQFQGYLRRERNFPYVESELGREQIIKYIFDRAFGVLYPRADPFVKPGELAEQYRLSHPEWPRHVRLLCPDRVTLAHYFVKSIVLDESSYYKIAALFELLPEWLDFLVAQGLLEPAQHEQARHDLSELHDKMLLTCEKYLHDPNIYQNLQHWPERAPR